MIAPFDRTNLVSDRDQRIAESIEFFFRLALGGLDHQGSGNRKRHGGGMKAIVDEPLRDVFDGDVGASLKGSAIDDELVCDAAAGSCVENLIVIGESTRHVVRIEDRDFGGACESFTPINAI